MARLLVEGYVSAWGLNNIPNSQGGRCHSIMRRELWPDRCFMFLLVFESVAGMYQERLLFWHLFLPIGVMAMLSLLVSLRFPKKKVPLLESTSICWEFFPCKTIHIIENLKNWGRTWEMAKYFKAYQIMFQLSIRHALTHYYTEVFLIPAYPMVSAYRLRCFGPCEIEVPGRLQEFGRKKAEHGMSGMSGRFEGTRWFSCWLWQFVSRIYEPFLKPFARGNNFFDPWHFPIWPAVIPCWPSMYLCRAHILKHQGDWLGDDVKNVHWLLIAGVDQVNLHQCNLRFDLCYTTRNLMSVPTTCSNSPPWILPSLHTWKSGNTFHLWRRCQHAMDKSES